MKQNHRRLNTAIGMIVVVIVILICGYTISTIAAQFKEKHDAKYYDMYLNYMENNYQEIETLEYNQVNKEKLRVTHNGVNNIIIVTYVKIDGVEHMVSCNIRDIIGGYGPEPYYEYKVTIYD